MVSEKHAEPTPQIVLEICDYLTPKGWKIDWGCGSGTTYTRFIHPGNRIFIKYYWAEFRAILSGNVIDTKAFEVNSLEDFIKGVALGSPRVVEEYLTYCDQGQILGEEMEDEFGITCTKPGKYLVSDSNKNYALCEEHKNSYLSSWEI